MKIYIATHKKFEYKPMNEYVPIHVGADINPNRFGYLLDNTGDNISSKNRNYCELTAVYWIWKNDTSDITGLCHYRRYLSFFNIKTPLFYLRENRIRKDLQCYDVILPKKQKTHMNSTVGENYYGPIGAGKEKDLTATRNIIVNRYPEYIDAFDKVVNRRESSYCNVLITHKNTFDQYCKWLFDILFELESITDLSEYTPTEARIYGFLSEILLNVWVEKNQLKVKYYPMVNTESESRFKKIIKKITRGK